MKEYPHRRYNPLTGDWILVSPQRTQRPWQGRIEDVANVQGRKHDPECYLCPGNVCAGDAKNPHYTETFVFTNDFSALLPTAPLESTTSDPLFRCEAVRGTCRVICFSPRHDVTLAQLPISHIRRVVEEWGKQIRELSETYRWVQVFENKGAVMGCSNPHPHGQIWATDQLPNEAAKEDRRQSEYLRKHGAVLLIDYIRHEREHVERIVVENEHWLAVVPFWATWPFETLLVPRRHVLRLPALTEAERDSLASVIKRLLTKYDNLFSTSFPYSMGWHGAPSDDGQHTHWQLHAHFYPPLLRSATVKKFMVGYEMLAEAQRDMTPEKAASCLREQSEIHYNEVTGL